MLRGKIYAFDLNKTYWMVPGAPGFALNVWLALSLDEVWR
jgi:hypothetical protein